LRYDDLYLPTDGLLHLGKLMGYYLGKIFER